jgi:hypothetical protein
MGLGTIEHGVRYCTLSKWSGSEDRCRWCDRASGEERWCSVDCADDYEAHHDWARARSTRLIHDRDCCVECGTGPESAALGRLVLRALIPMSPMDAARLWRSEAWLAFELSCSVDVVHHLPTPQRYRSGCHNHLDGLITLCRRCQDRRHSTIDLRRAG